MKWKGWNFLIKNKEADQVLTVAKVPFSTGFKTEK